MFHFSLMWKISAGDNLIVQHVKKIYFTLYTLGNVFQSITHHNNNAGHKSLLIQFGFSVYYHNKI